MLPTRDLAELIAPTAVDRFRTDIQGRVHQLFSGTSGQNRFAQLLSWPELNRILEQHRLTPPRLRLVRDGGAVVDPDEYFDRIPLRDGGDVARLLAGPFHERLRAGATLVVDAVEELHTPIAELAVGLERDVCEHVQVNLYASWGTSHGFDLHWDNHDVFALQVSGRKRWRLYGATRSAPLHRDLEPPPTPAGEPIAEYVLDEGDVLYLPRGHWHDVAAIGTPSLHLTFGFSPVTGIDLVEWLAERLRAQEVFRKDLPRFAEPSARKAHAEAMYAAISAALDPEIVDLFLAEHDGHARLRPGISLPWAATPDVLPPGDDATVCLLTPRATLRKVDADTVELLAVGHAWLTHISAEPVLRALVDGRPWTVNALAMQPDSTLPTAAVRALLAELTVAGLLAVRREQV
jgi:hypothetical protein